MGFQSFCHKIKSLKVIHSTNWNQNPIESNSWKRYHSGHPAAKVSVGSCFDAEYFFKQ
jgi:hypothetical protein